VSLVWTGHVPKRLSDEYQYAGARAPGAPSCESVRITVFLSSAKPNITLEAFNLSKALNFLKNEGYLIKKEKILKLFGLAVHL